MRVYRIAKEKYAHDLSGIGAKLYGGRWNPKGYALLYTSEHKSLAALEVLVHLNRNTIPDDLKLITIELPDVAVEKYNTGQDEKKLSNTALSIGFKKIGKEWIISKKSLGLAVPSVLISSEYNILINPMHPLFAKIQIVKFENFHFDKRFFI